MSSNVRKQCSDPTLKLRDLLARSPDKNLAALFHDRKASYSFNTRAAIFRGCQELSLKPGDEILAPDYNCGSELDAVRCAGLDVTFYPINRRTHINLAEVEARITPKTRAIYLIHYFGFLQPQAQALRDICDRHGLYLIEDCALSLLSGKTPVEGHIGDISVFCFYKFFPVLGGGALVVNNPDLQQPVDFNSRAPRKSVYKQRLRIILGMLIGIRGLNTLRKLRPRKTSEPAPDARRDLPDVPAHYYFDPRLQNARMDLFASWPLRSFDVEDVRQKRRENYLTYLKILSNLDGVTPLFPGLPETACPLNMPVLVKNRDHIAQALVEKGISATPWWAGYNRHLGWNAANQDALFLKDHVLALPSHQYLGRAEIEYIVSALKALAIST